MEELTAAEWERLWSRRTKPVGDLDSLNLRFDPVARVYHLQIPKDSK